MKTTLKVGAFILRPQPEGAERLLRFTHPDFPEAPIQIPGGTVEKGEAVESALHREIEEETGLANLRVRRKLGVSRSPSVTNEREVIVGTAGFSRRQTARPKRGRMWCEAKARTRTCAFNSRGARSSEVSRWRATSATFSPLNTFRNCTLRPSADPRPAPASNETIRSVATAATARMDLPRFLRECADRSSARGCIGKPDRFPEKASLGVGSFGALPYPQPHTQRNPL